MKKTAVLVAMLLSAGLAHADLYELEQADGVVSFSDRVATPVAAKRLDTAITHPLRPDNLPGVWLASSLDGRQTALTLRPDGSFIFDQTGRDTRWYMCGTWEGSTEALGLTVKALKRQLANGDIEQTAGSYPDEAQILSAQRDRIIVLIQGEKLIFDRAG